jgi:hypothetical protein
MVAQFCYHFRARHWTGQAALELEFLTFVRIVPEVSWLPTLPQMCLWIN